MKKLTFFSSLFVFVALLFSTGCATKKDAKKKTTNKRERYATGEEFTENFIPNSPILRGKKTMTISAKGMGVPPVNTISPAQAKALAKRAAVVDAYRQLGEKMYGIRIDAKDTIRDMASRSSVVKTRLQAIIKNAEIIDESYNNGLYEVTMELKLDARKWQRVLSGYSYNQR